jgi:Ankyrin repeats (3 copies)
MKFFMQYASLLTYLFLCTSHTCQAMDTRIARFNIAIISEDRFHDHTDSHLPANHPRNQSIFTHFIIKGVEWNDIALTQKGIAWKGNVNYINPERNNMSLLQIACANQHSDIVKILLTAPNINIDGDIVKILLTTPNINIDGNDILPILFLAIKKGDIDIVKQLVTHDCKTINMHEKINDDCILHAACRAGNSEITRFLLEKGALTTTENTIKRTPLAVAYFEAENFNAFYSQDLKRLLLKRNKHGNTQLHLAVSMGMKDNEREKFNCYITFLLQNGLSLWSYNKKKERPIDRAFKAYKKLLKRTSKKSKSYQKIFNFASQRQKMILNAFLPVQYASTALLLEQTDRHSFPLPKDIRFFIAQFYYALHLK